jgi:alkanesulfonate monooxygenase SsuD/methylene tetrahydromethanopterin reductase-like flavin-dependent oxidoreductase (luciferase family)
MHLALDLPAHWPNTGHHIDNLFPELLEVVKLGDEIGFDSFALAEHHFNDYFVQPAPLALASHIAAIMPRQRFIVAVMVLPYHQVQRLAGEITMTDQLTGGRLEVGFGRGGAKFEADRFGISHENSREIFDDRLRGLLALFSGKDVSYDGPHTKFPPLTILPPPRQRPHPPFWLAAIHPEAIFHCARKGFNVQAAALRRDMAAVQEMVKAFRQGVSESKSVMAAAPFFWAACRNRASSINADSVDPDRINLFECWRDQQSWKAWRKIAKLPRVKQRESFVKLYRSDKAEKPF